MAVLTGTNDADLLKGTFEGDIIRGLGGDDTILDRGSFAASDDFYFGGKGNDYITSVNGNDKLLGGLGNDAFEVTLNCDPHDSGYNRIVRGGAGLDELTIKDPENIQNVVVLNNHIDIIDKEGGITSVYGVEHYSFDV